MQIEPHRLPAPPRAADGRVDAWTGEQIVAYVPGAAAPREWATRQREPL